jgi:hypothetical protein
MYHSLPCYYFIVIMNILATWAVDQGLQVIYILSFWLHFGWHCPPWVRLWCPLGSLWGGLGSLRGAPGSHWGALGPLGHPWVPLGHILAFCQNWIPNSEHLALKSTICRQRLTCRNPPPHLKAFGAKVAHGPQIMTPLHSCCGLG